MFKPLLLKAEETQDSLRNLIEVLTSIKTSDDSQVLVDDKVFGNVTWGQIAAKVESLCSITLALPAEIESPLTPTHKITEAVTSFNNILANIKGIQDDINWINTQGGLQRYDKSNVHLYSNNGQARNLQSRFSNISTHADTACEPILFLKTIYHGRNTNVFKGVTTAVKNLLNAATKTKKEITKLKQSAKAEATKATSNAVSSQAEYDKIIELRKEALSEIGEIQTIKSQGQTALTEIQTTLDSSNHLRGEVQAFQGEFEEFQRKLDERNKQFENGSKELFQLVSTQKDALQELTNSAKTQQTVHIELTAESKKLLGLATSAGLANSYANARENLKKPMRLARIEFYVSLLFLCFSVLLVFNAIPVLQEYVQFPTFTVPDKVDFGTALLHVIGSASVRILTLLPSLVFIGFASRRQRNLFILQEQYRHKETLAASVSSFKEQAGEKYETAIAAAAFEALIPDPHATTSSIQEEQNKPNFLSRWFRQNIRKEVSAMLIPLQSEPPTKDK